MGNYILFSDEVRDRGVEGRGGGGRRGLGELQSSLNNFGKK